MEKAFCDAKDRRGLHLSGGDSKRSNESWPLSRCTKNHWKLRYQNKQSSNKKVILQLMSGDAHAQKGAERVTKMWQPMRCTNKLAKDSAGLLKRLSVY